MHIYRRRGGTARADRPLLPRNAALWELGDPGHDLTRRQMEGVHSTSTLNPPHPLAIRCFHAT